MATYTILVNRKKTQVEVPSDMPLLWVLRDHMDLVGTKFGCGIAQCGACTVHLDGVAVRSCVLPISKVGDAKVTTIEGLSENGDHPMQTAWIEHDVPQCGYCQAGQIMTAAALLESKGEIDDSAIKSAMNGNICRCGAYLKIQAAVKSALKS